jgi:hypothetical protein
MRLAMWESMFWSITLVFLKLSIMHVLLSIILENNSRAWLRNLAFVEGVPDFEEDT